MNNSYVGLRAEALESLLIEKGLIQSDQIDQTISLYNERVGPMNGARVVAKAWKDPEYKKRLVEDGTGAIEEFGLLVVKSINWSSWKIVNRCTTWWFAHCAPVIPGPFSGFRPDGTKILPIVLG